MATSRRVSWRAQFAPPEYEPDAGPDDGHAGDFRRSAVGADPARTLRDGASRQSDYDGL
jgi:hypothetical protein